SRPHRKLSGLRAQPCASTGPQDPWGKGPAAGGGPAGTMGSKAEGDPPAVFDWFFEAAGPASLQEAPPILRQFPPDFRDQEAMQMVPKFCFPFDVEREPPSPAVQHFTFALTDLSGTRRYGFCHLRAGAHSCLCILSHLPWFEVFYKLLNTVGDLLAQDQVSEVEELLLNLLQQPLPGTQASVELGRGVTVSSAQSIPPPAPGNSGPLSCFVAPDSGRAPLRSSEEPNGAGGGGDRREHRGAVRRAPGGEKGPTHRQQAEHPDIVRPRVLRPPVPHALGARADPHAAAAPARLLLCAHALPHRSALQSRRESAGEISGGGRGHERGLQYLGDALRRRASVAPRRGVPAEAAAKEGCAGARGRGFPSFPQSASPALWGLPRCAHLQPGPACDLQRRSLLGPEARGAPAGLPSTGCAPAAVQTVH
ncbi:unnamed protein product, partial [Gulo gulo]